MNWIKNLFIRHRKNDHNFDAVKKEIFDKNMNEALILNKKPKYIKELDFLDLIENNSDLSNQRKDFFNRINTFKTK